MIQVLHRAFDILEYISEEPEIPKSLGNIADKFALNHATCANIIKTMVGRRYLVQTGVKKGYILGPKSYALTGSAAYNKDVLEAARAEMDSLTKKLNENTVLAVLNENIRSIIHATAAEQDLQVRTAEEKSAYDSASGRLLFSMLSDLEIGRFLSRYGLPSEEIWKEGSTKEELMKTVQNIRQEQLAIQVTTNRQIIGLAVPVYRAERVIASLSVYMPEYRYMMVDKMAIVATLKASAANITKNLL